MPQSATENGTRLQPLEATAVDGRELPAPAPPARRKPRRTGRARVKTVPIIAKVNVPAQAKLGRSTLEFI